MLNLAIATLGVLLLAAGVMFAVAVAVVPPAPTGRSMHDPKKGDVIGALVVAVIGVGLIVVAVLL